MLTEAMIAILRPGTGLAALSPAGVARSPLAARHNRRHFVHDGDAGVRTIGVVTTSRADYSHLLPLLRAIDADSELELYLIVSGTHLSASHGGTVTEIERDGSYDRRAHCDSL